MSKVKVYLEDKRLLNKKDRLIIKKAIDLAKYDVAYCIYLKKNGTSEDTFAIVIDTESKDNESRNNTNIKEVINICKNKDYKCFLLNSCFDFFYYS